MTKTQRNIAKGVLVWGIAFAICFLPPIRRLDWWPGGPVGILIGLTAWAIYTGWRE